MVVLGIGLSLVELPLNLGGRLGGRDRHDDSDDQSYDESGQVVLRPVVRLRKRLV